MTGGIIQLVAYGHEDLFLTRDPQITFFKVIYRRHTNFAREDITQYFVHDPDFGKRTSCIISHDADLINRMCLKITLPAIPKFTTNNSATPDTNNMIDSSGTGVVNNFGTSGSPSEATQFAWIKRIGFAMIKYVEIEINGEVIDRHYGEWLHIFTSLTTRNITDGGLDRLIGNVPELTDFTDAKNEYVMYVPLQFWFCRASGLSLPLISLQFCDVKINVELFNLDQCYVLNPTHYIKCTGNIVNFEPYEYLFQKGADNVERYGIYSHYDIVNKRLYYTAISDRLTGVPYDGDVMLLDETTKTSLINAPKTDKYLIKGISSDFTIKPDLGVKSVTVYNKSLKNITLKECVVLADYVYLEDDERIKFAQTKHDYLIEQLYFTPNTPIEGTNPKIKLDIDQPCKLTVWLAQLDYISNFNDRFNYTDTHVLKRPYDDHYTDPTKIKIYNGKNIGESVGNTLIDEGEIKLNSQTRISKRVNEYYELLQPIQHSVNRLPRGSGMYSYGIMPTEPPPSGTTNMSQIESIDLNLKMNFRVNVNQKAKCRSYSLCYNVWRVDNGLSAPIFIR